MPESRDAISITTSLNSHTHAGTADAGNKPKGRRIGRTPKIECYRERNPSMDAHVFKAAGARLRTLPLDFDMNAINAKRRAMQDECS